MADLKNIVSYCDQLLDVAKFSDYCPNGLQIEGRTQVGRIITGVTASQAMIEAAIEQEADLLLVHHGYFWKGENPCLTGIKARRIRALLQADISLLAYHLPLDAHPEFGNNAQLANRLGLREDARFNNGQGPDLACAGTLAEALTAEQLADRIKATLGREPQHIVGNSASIKRVGWCSGAAQSYLEAAAQQGLDAFISGEISEPTVHIAREYGIHYFAAGHHATERYGVQALGSHLADHFDTEHQFIDIDNPV